MNVMNQPDNNFKNNNSNKLPALEQLFNHKLKQQNKINLKILTIKNKHNNRKNLNNNKNNSNNNN